MTDRYRESLEGAGGSEPLGTVPWTQIVPPGWQGYCCYCRRRLTVADWQEERIMAAGDSNPWHCLCVKHVLNDGPEYRAATKALARAVAGGPLMYFD